MKIVIVGAGAIGGYIGARLAHAGADVVLFARGPHLRAMQQHGVKVISPDGDFSARPQVTDDLASFWANTYALVRRDLRARYPKHAWPEDPYTAIAQRRPARKK